MSRERYNELIDQAHREVEGLKAELTEAQLLDFQNRLRVAE